MAAEHGSRYRYSKGCRCDACAESERIYQRNYRLRGGGPQVMGRLPADDLPEGAGPVESGVQAEIAGLVDIRPGLAQAALALARILDNPNAIPTKPAAAKTLAGLLDKLHSAGAPARRGHLASVRRLTDRGGA
jgi:hypothetical protein